MTRPFKRWYDDYPEISKSLVLLETFPSAILEIVASGVVTIAEDEFEAQELLQSVRSLGWEKVSALYKSKQKKRTYDQTPQLHKTMNYLHLMSHENRSFMGVKMLELINYVYEYLKMCKAHDHEMNEQEIGDIVYAYVKENPEETRRFLSQLKGMFIEEAKKGKQKTVVSQDQSQDFRVTNSHL